jgi:predicted NBD/HSP70 family sugar kinase
MGMMNKTTLYFAGLDIGGSTVKSVLVNGQGEQVGTLVEVPSRVTAGYQATFAQLELALDQLAQGVGVPRSAIGGVGLDVPAPNCDGVIWHQANLGDDWVGTNVRQRLSERIGTPVAMTNDGNAAALGEFAARPRHDGGLLLVAPGTGLGGGLVLPGGTAYVGSNGLALEVGHTSVPFREEDGKLPPCSCGKKGCLEAWVSLVALRRRLGLELAKEKWTDHALNSSQYTMEQKAFQLRDFADQEDPLAVEIFRQQAFILGYGLADMVRLFDPGLVVIGGGLAETGFRDHFMEWVLEGFDDRIWPVYRHNPLDPEQATTHFQWARSGDSAAALGMAFMAQKLSA